MDSLASVGDPRLVGTLSEEVYIYTYIDQAKSSPRLLSNTVCLPVSEARGGRVNNMALLLERDVDCLVP